MEDILCVDTVHGYKNSRNGLRQKCITFNNSLPILIDLLNLKPSLTIFEKIAEYKIYLHILQIVLLYLVVILVVIVSLYFVFYTVYASNKAESTSS